MIITRQKDLSQISGSIKQHKSIFIIGCGECAAQCKTGGKEEIDAMAANLMELGKEITGTMMVDVLCHEPLAKKDVRKDKDIISATDAVLVMACGAGVQSVTEAVKCSVVPGCDSLFLGNIKRAMSFQKKCSTCGECTLERYGGICAVTRCAKGLINGPCGGARNRKCEVNSSIDCGWILIYERLRSLNNEDILSSIFPPRNHINIGM